MIFKLYKYNFFFRIFGANFLNLIIKFFKYLYKWNNLLASKTHFKHSFLMIMLLGKRQRST